MCILGMLSFDAIAFLPYVTCLTNLILRFWYAVILLIDEVMQCIYSAVPWAPGGTKFTRNPPPPEGIEIIYNYGKEDQ